MAGRRTQDFPHIKPERYSYSNAYRQQAPFLPDANDTARQESVSPLLIPETNPGYIPQGCTHNELHLPPSTKIFAVSS